MKPLRFLTVGILVCSVMMLFCSPSLRAATDVVPLITPPSGGTAFILGAGLVSLCTKHAPDLGIVHEASQGTMDIIRRMQALESQNKGCYGGTFSTADGLRAYKGLGEYAAKPFPTLRGIFINQRLEIVLVVPANSSIKSFADLKGKRIGMGGPGSSPALSALMLLEYHGITEKDFKPYYYVYRESVDGIQDGSLDAGVFVGGQPIASITELATRKGVRIVPPDETALKKLIADHPNCFRSIIKGKTYKGIDQDVAALGDAGALWTHAGTGTDAVYKFVKTIFDHLPEYYAIHPGAKVLTPEAAIDGMTVPLHPGAEKYYREAGIIKK